MEITRRSLFGGFVILLLPKAAKLPEHDAEIELLFENGDIQRIFFTRNKENKMFMVHNTMEHNNLKIETNWLRKNPGFKLGQLHGYNGPEEGDIDIHYTGWNSFGDVVCESKVIRKTWRDKTYDLNV